MPDALSVSELLAGVDRALATQFPGPVWVAGETSGMRRTHRGAVFFQLVDKDKTDHAVTVVARALIMRDVERSLDAAKVGSLRDGVEIKIEGTVAQRSGRLQLSLLRIDTDFIAGKLAADRDAILERLRLEKLVEKNRQLPIPLVPTRVGLVTSIRSAAHADFLNQLNGSGFRFSVKTVAAAMQGDASAVSVADAIDRLQSVDVDVIAVVRGGGAKLDLASFDSEELARTIAASTKPVITGIGHQIDRTIADDVASVSLKTPTAAGEWFVSRVADFSDRVERATVSIRDQARAARRRAVDKLDGTARELRAARSLLGRHRDHLAHLETRIADRSRDVVVLQRERLDSLSQLVATVGLEPTLKRGFALVSRPDGSLVSRASMLSKTERVSVKMADGSVGMIVEESL